MRFVSPRVACSCRLAAFTFALFFCLLGRLHAANYAMALPSGYLCSQQPGWGGAQVGSLGQFGGYPNYANGTFTVSGTGTQIYGTADSFTFAYQGLFGDGSIVARVVSVQGGSGYVAAGVMIRETLDAGSTNAKIAYWPSYGDLYFDTRTGADGSTAEPGTLSATTPYWIKLVRSGSTFTSYASPDSANWTQVGASQTMTMAQRAYMGLAVTNGSSPTPATATFDNVSTSSNTPMPCIGSISATTGDVGSQVVIAGSGFGLAQGSSQVLLNGSPVTVTLWSETSIVITIPEGAASGNLLVYDPQNPLGAVGAYSNAVRFTVTPQPLPDGWLDSDIGSFGLFGSATYANGAFTVSGAGSQIYGTTDSFHFAYQSLTGDGSIVARLVSLQGSRTTFVSAGVMIRETLNAGSTNAKLADWMSFYAFYTDVRATAYGNTAEPGSIDETPPHWMKVARSGNNFDSYVSSDGINWTEVGGTQTISMAQTVYVGLAVDSGDTTALATATFDNVSVSTSGTTTPVISGLSATTGAVGSPITISGSNFGASQQGSEVLLNQQAMTVNTWSDTSINVTIPAGATSGFLTVSVAPDMNSSNPVRLVVTSQPLPTGWLDTDVGTIGVAGSATYTDGTFTVSGSGSQIYGTADAFHFVYQQMLGDGSVVARLVSVQNAPGSAAAGVMIRETLDSGSANAKTADWPSYGGYCYFDARTTTGGNTAEPGYVNTTLPYWVKIVRSGSTFSSYTSSDGGNWTQVGPSQTINMAQTVYVGLAVTGGSTSAVATATFDNVAVTTSSQGPSVASVSPSTATVGTPVMISGLNFGANQGSSTVSFDGVPADSITAWADSQITATVPASATTGPVAVFANGLQSNSNVIFTVSPTVSSISPTSGAIMSQVQISGSGFGTAQGSSTVAFNGIVSPVVGWSATSITALVPPGATTGNVVVTVNGVASGGTNFNVTTPPTQIAPNISNISTATAGVGQQVTITGTGFGATEGTGNVLLGTMLGFVVSWSDQTIQATVSAGSTSGVVQVQQNGLSSNSVALTVSSAAIGSVQPTHGLAGTSVTISGSGFGTDQGNGMVWLGTATGTVTNWSDGSITASVAAGSASGTVQVLQNGSWSNSVPFTIDTPNIRTVNPNSATAGTVITITGSGFGSTQGSGIVWIGNAPGVVTGWNDGTIMASVASNAVSGVAKVQQGGVWSNATTFTVPTNFGGGTSVTLVPNLITMVFGSTQSIQALDSTGQSVTGLSWTSSNTAVAMLSTDDPPIITAVGSGNATITAGNASADVTVVTSALRAGTVIWSNPGEGSGVSNIVPAVPSSTGVADVFALNADCNLQAIKSDGTVAWSKSIGTTTDQNGTSSCNQFLPDFQGGAVVNTGQSIYRLDGVTGTPSTAFGSSTSCFTTPIVSTDGTVFVVSVTGIYPTECNYAYLHTSLANQYGSWWGVPGSSMAVVAINPSTGQQNFSVSMENSSFTFPNWHYTENTSVGTPIIAGDGYFYLPYQYGEYSYNGTEDGLQIVTAEHSRLLRVGLAGDSSKIVLEDLSSSTVAGASGFFESDLNASMPSVITNADQGALASYGISTNSRTMNNGAPPSSSTKVSFYLVTTSGASVTLKAQTTGVPGQQSAIKPTLQRQDGNFIGTASTSVGNSMIGFSPSGSTLFTVANETPLMVTLGGGVVGTSGSTYDQNGNANGQVTTGITQSWTGYSYQNSASFSLVANAAPTPDPSFAPFQHANQSANDTAKRQISAHLELRFGGNLHVSANDPVQTFLHNFGETLLGMQSGGFPEPPPPDNGALNGCYAGYELVATVTPSDFTGPVTIRRNVNSESCWVGSNPQFPDTPTNPCGFGSPPYDDTGDSISTDPSTATGQVFNLDAVGYYGSHVVYNPPYRHRVNFETYAVGPDGIKISKTINFYVRLSCQTNSDGVGFFSQDVPGDNILGTGTTPLSLNLQ